MTIRENVALAPLTTLRVGGAARYFVEARSEDEVRKAVAFAKSRGLALFVLGGGSNLVVADAGWPGLVLKIAIGGMASPTLQSATGSSKVFSIGAGVNWDDFVASVVSQNCAGIECLSGIPGSVGGTPVQNVGAYGQEVAETIESVLALDMRENRVVKISNKECGFRYRSSIFNRAEDGERGRYIILQVDFRLKCGGAPCLKYGDLQKWFTGRTGTPSLIEVREAVLEIRRRKGMLIVAGEADARSAGSFFKNPVLSEEEFRRLAERAAARGLSIPSYPALDAQHKVSAAWLVEHSGFGKGFRLGRAAISSKHALALINPGEAEARDIVTLKEAIQLGVDKTWGVRVDPEPVFLGF
ncbi:MAG TPA: UDP-N-acetylmuramate dehydrogenase [Terriglobales bacterium]|nr:UDP-N-acetylmuramate dehydrogenase [Terriglobales bacterium]